MKDAERMWDKLSKNYDRSITIDQVKNYQSFNYLVEYLDPDSVVLDFGCATGTLALALTDKVKTIHGIDLSSKMIESAKYRADELGIDNVDFFQSTIQDDRLANDSYNMILAFNVLHLLEDVSGIIQRVHQLLQSGGMFVTLTPCIAERRMMKHLLSFAKKIGVLPHINTFRTSELRDTIENGNFQIIQNTTLDNNPLEHFIIAMKQ